VASSAKRVQPLTRRRILEAALRVVDTEGLPSLNMRRIGAELGVRAMALYRHVENKDALVAGVVDLMFEDLSGAGRGDDVIAIVRRFFHSLHDVLTAHPNALPLVAASALQRGNARAQTEAVVQALREAGVADAWGVFHAFASFTLGYALLEVGGFVGGVPDEGPFVRRPVAVHADETEESSGAHDRYQQALDRFLLVVQPA
jgi:TetR/AcrR family tetracycline transcriptional repressor